MLPVGSLISDAAAGSGLIAASIAICGFLGQIRPALARKDDQEVRVATGVGGLIGLAVALAIITAALG
jgi:hypothetical protein